MIGVYGSSPERERKASADRAARLADKRAVLAARLERMSR